MGRRPLPSASEAAEILARKRSRPPRKPPPPAARSLAKFLKETEDRFGKGPRALAARWPEIIADERLARFTEPVKLVKQRGKEGSILELRVEGPAAALIQHQAEDILARVNLILGGQEATRLRIVQGPVKLRASRSAPPRRRRPTGPLDAAVEQELLEGLKGAPDTPLKEALLRLGRAVARARPDRADGGGD